MALLEADDAVEQIACSTGQIECLWRDSREALPQLHRKIVDTGIPLVSFALEGDNLEDLYMQISRHHTS